MDLVKLRNRSGTNLHVAQLQGREVEAGAEVSVAGRLVDASAVRVLLGTEDVTELAADAIYVAHPTADGEQLLAWPTANWELVKPTRKDKE